MVAAGGIDAGTAAGVCGLAFVGRRGFGRGCAFVFGVCGVCGELAVCTGVCAFAAGVEAEAGGVEVDGACSAGEEPGGLCRLFPGCGVAAFIGGVDSRCEKGGCSGT